MDIKCGTDIIEVQRIKDAIRKYDDKFLKKIYTEKEIEYCVNKGKMCYEHFAARFAAKEAVFKAISGMLNDKYDITWTDIEILNDEHGRPFVNIKDGIIKCSYNIDISLSHIKDYAIANCIVVEE
jgi:holo-[acyl-carrier protein] synthase